MQTFACPFTAQPIEANSVLYVADWCGVIRAIDPGSGNVFWSRQLGTSPTSCGDFLPLTSLGILSSTQRTIASLLLQAMIKSARLIRRPAATSRGTP